MASSGDQQREASIGEIENWNLDRLVDPPTKVFGMMGKSAGAWNYSKVDSSGQLAVSSIDAGNFRISAIGGISVSAIVTGDDAGQFRISAIQGDAGLLHISAYSTDANQLHVSSYFASLDTTNNVDKVEQQFSYSNLAISGISTVKGSAGLLHSIVINTRGTGSTLKIYDNTAASGTLIGTLDTTLSIGTFDYDVKFLTGLTLSATGTTFADITTSYR